MKVLVTVPRLEQPGGVASYYNTLKPALDSSIEHIEIGQTSAETSFCSTAIRMIKDYVAFLKKLHKGDHALVHINPSLLYKSFLRDGCFLLLAKLYRKSVLVIFHGWDKDFEKTLERYLLPLFRLFYGKADVFVVLANEFKNKLREWGCQQPIFVETTVVDDKVMNIGDDILHRKREESPTFNVLFLARVEKGKGIYETLDAFAILKQNVSHARLIIAGDGSEKNPAKEYAMKRGIQDVEFVGHVVGRQKEEVLANSHVYVFPTYSEGMPTSVLEAMAFGLPVITRPVGGLNDFFEDKRMGYLTASLDPKVFATLTESLADDAQVREKMGEYNRSFAKAHFMATKAAVRLKHIYATIAASG